MTLLDSLFEAITRLDGEALVMHVGEKPYVVLSSATVSAVRGPVAWGQVELSSRPLTAPAMSSMLAQMLSEDQRRLLDDLGAIEEEIEVPGETGGRFVVTAARGGEDVWVEVRRRKETHDQVAEPSTNSDLSALVPEEVVSTASASEATAIPTDFAKPEVERGAAEALASREAEFALKAEAALAARRAELESIADAMLAHRRTDLASEAEAALATRRAELESIGEAALARRRGELAAEAEAALTTRRAELESQVEAALAQGRAELASQAEAAIAARGAELEAEAARALAASEESVTSRLNTEFAAKEAELVRRMEAAVAATTAQLSAQADAALAETRAALGSELQSTLAARESALREDLRKSFDHREAELKALVDAAVAERDAALKAQVDAARAAQEAVAAAEAQVAAMAHQTQMALAEHEIKADAERAASEAAEAQRLLGEKESAIADEARREIERESQQLAELHLALAEKEQALSAEAERLREKEAAVAAEVQRALAEKEAAISEARRLAEKAVGLSVETQRALVEKEQAIVDESRRALAEKETALAAEAARKLAAKEKALVADSQRRLAEREAALIEENRRALAATEAALADAVQRDLAQKEAAFAARSRQLADREARLAEIERERAAIEVVHARESDAMRAADAEAERLAETLAVFSAEADAEQAAVELAKDREGPAAAPTEPTTAVVTPIARPPLKLQPAQPASPTATASTEASLVEVLRAAAERGASMVYAVVDTRPMMRISGEIALVGTQAPVAAGDVERFIFQFAPRELVAHPTPEWTCAVPDVGRVRCVAFHDHSGAGLIFHLPSREAAVADDVRISDQLRSLCTEADGLIVVAGPRSSGKSALLNEFVDVINTTRYDHVITIESQIRRFHEKRLSFISQREVRGDGDAIAKAARTALREGPDVLVIEDLRAPEALVAALDAARAGRLVFGSISAPTTTGAIERLIDAFPADRRSQVRASLAGALRAVVAQILVPKIAGGRIAAREVLLSSPAVRKVILDGAISQLPFAIESGRNLGMRTIVDALGALVRDGVVSIAAACAAAPDRLALVSALERDGIDVSGIERRA